LDWPPEIVDNRPEAWLPTPPRTASAWLLHGPVGTATVPATLSQPPTTLDQLSPATLYSPPVTDANGAPIVLPRPATIPP
jgi:hypothetical protein